MARAWLAACLCALVLPAPLWAEPEDSWAAEETAHFVVHHERMGFSPGDLSRTEMIYSALHPDLWRLVPWMSDRKTTIFLYKDREGYLGGRFKPPAWSGGLLGVVDGRPALALYEPMDTAAAAHELTHLFFHSYFEEKKAQAPPWLDEGLAGMLQDEALAPPNAGDKGPVASPALPMERFLAERPARDSPQARVAAWYRQAHSVVRFLKRGHNDLSFAEFCGALREGEPIGDALKAAYGYEDLAAFERAWNVWRPKKAKGLPVGLDDR